MLSRFRRLPGKVFAQLRLLRDDPERFGRNLLQYTNPKRFEAGLVDILRQPPLQVQITAGLPPALNVLQPSLNPDAMTGGPNTIVLLAALVAECGVKVRITTTSPEQTDRAWFTRHVTELLGRPGPDLEIAPAAAPGAPAGIGADDLWLATHWTTAQALRLVLPRMRRGWFLYLVQDFEPGFYAWSSNYALALETYSMPHRAIINERLLAEYLLLQAPGLYADPSFVATRCMVFEPAVDRRVFRPPAGAREIGRRRLLFYARPTNPRNLMGLGLEALRMAVAADAFSGEWEFLSIGARGSLPELSLGRGHRLRPAAWESYDAYAETLRRADILLCPMLSPHTSYPVLEMAACGGIVVTNCFGPKTAPVLARLSPDLIGVAPTLQGFVDGIRAAAARPADTRTDRLTLPSRWDTALQPAAHWAAAAVREASP